jgi:hypothetical protein
MEIREDIMVLATIDVYVKIYYILIINAWKNEYDVS